MSHKKKGVESDRQEEGKGGRGLLKEPTLSSTTGNFKCAPKTSRGRIIHNYSAS